MKRKQKPQRKHQARSSAKSTTRSRKTPTTSSNWDQSVRAELGDSSVKSPAKNPSETERGVFTPGEIGQIGNLDQEGEGNRQNSEAQELEEIEPDKFLKQR